MTFKDIREEIYKRMQDYSKIAATDSIDALLDERDYFTSMLSFIGQVELESQVDMWKCEVRYEKAKSEAFMGARADKAEKTAGEIAKLESMDKYLEFGLAKTKYDNVRRLREMTNKQIDTISQRAAVLRKELDSINHQ